MSHAHFAWYKLVTTDMPAARSFYGSVLGWTAHDAATSNFAYSIFQRPVTLRSTGSWRCRWGGCAGGLPGAFKGLSCRLSDVIK
jgi:hypothetical protein